MSFNDPGYCPVRRRILRRDLNPENEESPMNGSTTLLNPSECALLLVDLQAGLGYGVESMPRQVLMNNAVALAKTATTFGVPVVATTSASKVYSGPCFRSSS